MNRIGSFKNCFIGYSANENNRIISSSGGVIREIYEYLLREKKIDGALIVVQENKVFFTKMAYRVEDLDQMENSVYAPVKFSPGLKQIEPDKKYAVTFISCQYSKLIPYMNNISYMFGLLCRGTYQKESMDIFANHMGIKEYNAFNFRRNGWPGEIEIITTDAVQSFNRWPSIIKNPRLRSAKEGAFCKTTYLPKCQNCKYSFSCEEADVSFGDAWLPELANDKKGYSLVITRTSRGDTLIEEMMASGYLKLDHANIDDVEKSLDDPNINKWHNFKVKVFKSGNGWLLPYIHLFQELVWGFPAIFKEAIRRIFHKFT